MMTGKSSETRLAERIASQCHRMSRYIHIHFFRLQLMFKRAVLVAWQLDVISTMRFDRHLSGG